MVAPHVTMVGICEDIGLFPRICTMQRRAPTSRYCAYGLPTVGSQDISTNRLCMETLCVPLCAEVTNASSPSNLNQEQTFGKLTTYGDECPQNGSKHIAPSPDAAPGSLCGCHAPASRSLICRRELPVEIFSVRSSNENDWAIRSH